jgi:hypothetical protein
VSESDAAGVVGWFPFPKRETPTRHLEPKPDCKWLESFNLQLETYFLMITRPRWQTGFTKYFDEKAWAVIEEQARRRSSGKRPVKDVLKGVEGRKQGARVRQTIATASYHLERVGKFEDWQANNLRRGFARWHILAAFEPGAWYALSDIATLSGVPRKTVGAKVLQHLKPEGLIIAASNPDWYDRRDECGFKVWLEPRYLYSLTERGIAARAVARGELEAMGWPSYSGARI